MDNQQNKPTKLQKTQPTQLHLNPSPPLPRNQKDQSTKTVMPILQIKSLIFPPFFSKEFHFLNLLILLLQDKNAPKLITNIMTKNKGHNTIMVKAKNLDYPSSSTSYLSIKQTASRVMYPISRYAPNISNSVMLFQILSLNIYFRTIRKSNLNIFRPTTINNPHNLSCGFIYAGGSLWHFGHIVLYMYHSPHWRTKQD